MAASPHIVPVAVIRSRRNWAAVALFAGAYACSDAAYRLGTSAPTDQSPQGSAGGGVGSGGRGAGNASDAGGRDSVKGSDAAVAGSSGGPAGLGCATNDACGYVVPQGERRRRRADVVLAVDTASTPTEALGLVELSLNPFADALASNWIELRLVVLARQTPPGVCVPPPLGSGSCEPQGADSMLPNLFHHPWAVVDGGNALDAIFQEFPVYSPVFEPLADSTLIVVTGGDAAAPWNNASSFDEAYTALRRPTASFPWRLSAYYGFYECEGIRAEGRAYREIVERTGGIHADLCTESPQVAFERMASSIVDAVLPCTFVLPQPTPERPIDLQKINVVVRVPGSDEVVVPFVGSADRCGGAFGGWYYDDPLRTSAIVMCAESCARVRSTRDAEFLVSIGCPTIATPTCN
jgi:hypothetical protein